MKTAEEIVCREALAPVFCNGLWCQNKFGHRIIENCHYIWLIWLLRSRSQSAKAKQTNSIASMVSFPNVSLWHELLFLKKLGTASEHQSGDCGNAKLFANCWKYSGEQQIANSLPKPQPTGTPQKLDESQSEPLATRFLLFFVYPFECWNIFASNLLLL